MPGHVGPVVSSICPNIAGNGGNLSEGMGMIHDSVDRSNWEGLAGFFEGLGVEGTQDMVVSNIKACYKEPNG